MTGKKLFAILLAAVLMLTAAGCGKTDDAEDYAARIAQLEAENARLQAQLDALLTQGSAAVIQSADLADWTLEVAAWNDGNGATVTFSAVPTAYIEGQKAALSIRVGDLEAESTNCNWDGSAFTGSVELPAADGYSYYCILTGADGSQQQIELNSPDHITDESLVYLGSYLSAYGSFVVEDWAVSDGDLCIKTGYVQCQLPRISYGSMASGISGAALVLKLNDTEVSRQAITLEPDEGEGSYHATLSNLLLDMPAIEDESQLNLWLEVTLNTGSVVKIIGGSWFGSDGQLHLSVG